MESKGGRFVDAEGRSLVLRGVNLGGNAKLPARPAGWTHLREGFYDAPGKYRPAPSFVGRPIPLAEADAHFERLARWGMRFERLLVTWEAVEGAGPGIYDKAYLDYIEALVELAGRHGLSLFVDPHQDAWSRWTGGDGAPRWTLEAVGFEPRSLHASGAAMLHQEMGEAYPRMQWFSNYSRLGAATMFTLFFAGEAAAPGLRALPGSPGEGEPLQELLQGRYIAAMAELARRLAPHPNVAGFDSLNEPGSGWIGLADIASREGAFTSLGPSPTALEAMAAGEGLPVEVSVLGVRGAAIRELRREAFGRPGTRAWKEGVDCLWRRAGVWDTEGGRGIRVLDPGRFRGGSLADFKGRHFKPFVERFAREIRAAAEGARRFTVFVEGVPEGGRPDWGPDDTPDVANATHWYDALTLSMKLWTGFAAYDPEEGRLVLGPRRVRAFFREALGRIARHSRERMGGVPTLIGEFGLPFDLNGGRGIRSGNYRTHERALAAYHDGLDANLLDSTLWNYNPDSSRERGDGWNGEDLSVWCADEAAEGRTETGDPRDAGGRALRGFVRPYALAVAGELLAMSFSAGTGRFHLRWKPDPAIKAPTRVFVPRLQYPRGFSLAVAGCAAAPGSAAEAAVPGPLSEPLVLELAAEPGAEECVLRLARL